MNNSTMRLALDIHGSTDTGSNRAGTTNGLVDTGNNRLLKAQGGTIPITTMKDAAGKCMKAIGTTRTMTTTTTDMGATIASVR
jgi:hypothetical protein